MHTSLNSSIGGAIALTKMRLASERNGPPETLILSACHLYKLPLFVQANVQKCGTSDSYALGYPESTKFIPNTSYFRSIATVV